MDLLPTNRIAQHNGATLLLICADLLRNDSTSLLIGSTSPLSQLTLLLADPISLQNKIVA